MAAVATLLGQWAVNINRLQRALKDEHGSVVDLLLEFPDDFQMQQVLQEIAALDGVTVQRISSYPSGGGLRYDLEVRQRMFCSDLPPAQVLTTSAPLLCAARWALLVDTTTFEVLLQTPLAPDVDRADLARLAPFDRSHTGELPPGPDAGSSTTHVAIIALPAYQTLLIGRPQGPPFAGSELARLSYLASCLECPDSDARAVEAHDASIPQ